MNIGIVTAWFERGAAYVSRSYMELLQKEGHNVFIFARGGERHESQNYSEWNENNVTRSKVFGCTKVPKKQLVKWLKRYRIETVFFNEQREYSILYYLKKAYPNIKLGAYVDYYTEDTLVFFNLFDFVICNTKRHYFAMSFHKQKYYLPWWVDTDLYRPSEMNRSQLTFFHSVGMSTRKGTDILIEAFLNNELYQKSKLVIHTQIPIEKVCNYSSDFLSKHNITIIEKTVGAPGLYHLGDVYVYPTKLDGLGLTMYEALSCGLPILTTDFPPMNEVGDESCSRRIKVKDFYCRSDAYYFPMAICDENDLTNQMEWFINNKPLINQMKLNARDYALNHYSQNNRSKTISEIFMNAKSIDIGKELDVFFSGFFEKPPLLKRIVKAIKNQ